MSLGFNLAAACLRCKNVVVRDGLAMASACNGGRLLRMPVGENRLCLG